MHGRIERESESNMANAASPEPKALADRALLRSTACLLVFSFVSFARRWETGKLTRVRVSLERRRATKWGKNEKQEEEEEEIGGRRRGRVFRPMTLKTTVTRLENPHLSAACQKTTTTTTSDGLVLPRVHLNPENLSKHRLRVFPLTLGKIDRAHRCSGFVAKSRSTENSICPATIGR